MSCHFRAADGSDQIVDLNWVTDVARGQSYIRVGWKGLIVLDPAMGRLIELRDGPADVRGNCASEAEEVNDEYVCITYGVVPADLPRLRANPKSWKLVEL
jgi:hypothetical protein